MAIFVSITKRKYENFDIGFMTKEEEEEREATSLSVFPSALIIARQTWAKQKHKFPLAPRKKMKTNQKLFSPLFFIFSKPLLLLFSSVASVQSGFLLFPFAPLSFLLSFLLFSSSSSSPELNNPAS